MKSLITKSLIRSGLVVASMALTASAAMAANLPVAHKSVPVAHASRLQATARVAARYGQPPLPGYNNLGQLVEGFFGGVLPPQYTPLIASAAARASASHQDSGSYDSSWDSPSSPTPIDNSASDAAIAGEEADLNALQQSMQATQEQNDEAEAMNNADIAAAEQTEINAGM